MQVPEDQWKQIEEVHRWVRNRLRDVRLARGITQEQLGKMLTHGGASGSRICDFETGRSDWKGSTMLRHARFLNINLDKLFVGCPRWTRTKIAPAESTVIITKDRLEQILRRHASDTVSQKILEDIAMEEV